MITTKFFSGMEEYGNYFSLNQPKIVSFIVFLSWGVETTSGGNKS